MRYNIAVKIFLVRHTAYSNPDNIFPFHLPLVLSKEGVEHALRIGDWFKNHSLIKLPIYTSPIKRSSQTADIIAKIIDSKVSSDERLTEASCPNLQGKKAPDDEEETWKMQCRDSSRESSESLQKRALECFQEKLKKDKNCILVSHGDPLAALLYYLIKKPLTRCLFDDDHYKLYIKKGEIVQIEIKDGFEIERFAV